MPFAREIQRLMLGLLITFALVGLSAAYWAVTGPDTILSREDNPRLVEAQAAIVRGNIYARDGELLVESIQNPNGRVSRRFVEQSTNGVMGYYSLRYGVGGVEAAYNTTLRGDDLPHNLSSYLTRDLLHLPQRGSDLRLTFDLTIQEAIYEAMQGHTGAAVALDVPSGAVLGMISLPTYNPNTLDADWTRLLEATNNPFFNRALQGEYQPGGVMQTPLITAAFIANEPLNVVIEGAAETVQIDGIEISCAERPPSNRLTFSEAYAFACPAPFVDLFNRLGEETVQETIDLFQLGRDFTLPGFVPEPDPLASTPTADSSLHTPLETALGQGSLTVSPLDIAVMTAAVINDGNAPQPYALTATRPPESEVWIPVQTVLPTIPVTTAETSRRIQELMRSATVIGSARPAARSGMTIGGHSSLAYSGDGTQAWFIGFVITGQRQGVVVAVVLENTDHATEAAAIGGQILETAYQQSTTTVGTP